MGSTATADGYRPHLDALRALAVVPVVLQHSLPWEGLPVLHDIGMVGVTLFFTLSGYLITGILLRARAANSTRQGAFRALRAFYVRRTLRIFPVYYLVLGALVLLNVNGIRDYWLWHGLYLSNMLAALKSRYIFPTHFWSLAVEEQFYLLWAPAVLFLPQRWLKPIAWAMVAAGPVSRGLLFALTASRTTSWVPVTSCMDLLGIGCLLAMATEGERPDRWFTGPRWLVGAVVLAVGVSALDVVNRGRALAITVHTLPWAILACAAIERAAAGFNGFIGRLAGWRPIVHVGRISYGIYVYHVFAPRMLTFLTEQGLPLATFTVRGLPRLVAVSLLTLATAAVSWRLLEAPINRLKVRFPYSRS